MKEWALDLHLHTLLSPCADNSMTPVAILGRALELGLEVVAITDHNTAENVAAFVDKGKEIGIKVFPGMELQTREDVHLVCLFEQLEQVIEWQEIVYEKLPDLKNKKEIFGEQWVVDQEGQKIREVERLLLVGTTLSVEEAVAIVHKLGGLCIAAHIDRQAFSLWGHLGCIPPGLPLDGVELTPHLSRQPEQIAQVKKEGFAYVVSSDAHYPDSIYPPQCFACLEEVSLAELQLALKNQAGRSIRTLR
jgi:PHP family Zn ribbon phosphoesterase